MLLFFPGYPQFIHGLTEIYVYFRYLQCGVTSKVFCHLNKSKQPMSERVKISPMRRDAKEALEMIGKLTDHG